MCVPTWFVLGIPYIDLRCGHRRDSTVSYLGIDEEREKEERKEGRKSS